MNLKTCMILAAAAPLMTGCLSGRGVHTVPVERDYHSLESHSYEEAKPQVEAAHRVGAHHFAPYEYDSAKAYLKYAHEARLEGDRKGHKDYSTLALKYAAEAAAKGAGIPDGGELAMPDDIETATAEFERIKARYLELSACRAKLVAPHIYAHIETHIAQAEHEIIERCHYPEGIRYLRGVESDIDAIWAMDFDKDSHVDMKDGDPWIAEDPDGFQDEDGIPEPKPYPILDSVLFDTDKADLKAEYRGYLRGIADMLNDGYKEATLILSAHTDSDADDAYNQELSLKREEAVRAFLVGEGVDASRVTSSHHGEADPAADNSSAAGKAQNRRVELMLDSPDPVSPYCD
jgi:outer membrane protein OmpA-like peptidoglycan-associated protein